jgi:PAS domain S-box-containing protein
MFSSRSGTKKMNTCCQAMSPCFPHPSDQRRPPLTETSGSAPGDGIKTGLKLFSKLRPAESEEDGDPPPGAVCTMNWVTVTWSMNAGACLTLAAFYGVVWCKQRENRVYLLFSCSAVAAAVISAFELRMLNATTVQQYELLMRWIHVPVWVLTVSFVAFVRLYLHAGRPWLAWSIYALRTLVLILNFIFPVSINFNTLTGVRHFAWGGDIISVPVGIPNPWGLLSQITLLLLLIFSIDATITVWRRRDRRRALLVGGSMVFGAILAWHVPMVIWGIIEAPFFLAFTYTGVVAAMGYELSRDMARAARLTCELEVSEKRFSLAADSSNVGMWEWDLEKDEIWVSPTRRAQLGFPASGRITFDELISRWHEGDRDKARQAVNEAIQHGKDYEAEFRVVRADGSMQWVSARGRVQVDEHGKPKRLTGISLDITARKEAEVLAQQQRGELERLRQQKTAFLEREVAERARLEREVIESCAREQRRIAYDLHDGVGQQLVSIAVSAKLLEEELRPNRPTEAKKASAIVRIANEAARQARLTARSLEGADGVGDLKMALESLAVNMSQNCRVRSTVEANSASLPVSAPVAAQLYRIAQEAVRNAVEHGAAREVLIQLTFGHRDMLLTIQDDGEGFNTKTNGHGMGLRIMRYRAQSIGGSCEVDTGPDRGTIVYCRVPMEAQPSLSTIS